MVKKTTVFGSREFCLRHFLPEASCLTITARMLLSLAWLVKQMAVPENGCKRYGRYLHAILLGVAKQHNLDWIN